MDEQLRGPAGRGRVVTLRDFDAAWARRWSPKLPPTRVDWAALLDVKLHGNWSQGETWWLLEDGLNWDEQHDRWIAERILEYLGLPFDSRPVFR